MRMSTVFIAFVLVYALEIPAIAQEYAPDEAPSEQNSKVLGTVIHGNTTIVFEAADTRDIKVTRLRIWDDFAEEHSKIARTLAYKPSLVDDPTYLKNHTALAAFLQSHPDIKEEMVENSGNFVAIPPRPGE